MAGQSLDAPYIDSASSEVLRSASAKGVPPKHLFPISQGVNAEQLRCGSDGAFNASFGRGLPVFSREQWEEFS